jgi:hypothetical protein
LQINGEQTKKKTGTGKLRRKKGQTPREVIKPKCALEYQKGMGGVDLQDQMTVLFPTMRSTVKGYRKILFYLLDMCISVERKEPATPTSGPTLHSNC